MARLPRIVIPGMAHHVTQRGNRRQATFFDPEDYEIYLKTMRLSCTMYGVKILAYCLMTNHVHLIVVPSCVESLSKAIARAHESYTRYINFKHKWRGYLWQGRYSSFPMDEGHLYHGFSYVELNPVKAKMVKKPEDYSYSSARAHLRMQDDPYLDDVTKVIDQIGDWKAYLETSLEDAIHRDMEKSEKSGRPLGTPLFISQLEEDLGIPIAIRKSGRKRKVF
jgi:putative transposase